MRLRVADDAVKKFTSTATIRHDIADDGDEHVHDIATAHDADDDV